MGLLHSNLVFLGPESAKLTLFVPLDSLVVPPPLIQGHDGLGETKEQDHYYDPSHLPSSHSSVFLPRSLSRMRSNPDTMLGAHN